MCQIQDVNIHENNIDNIIKLIKSYGKKVGISIKPNTPAEKIYEYLNDIDLVLVMTVEPGFGGQEFMHDCAMKIPLIKEKAPENLIIQVDGGINKETSKQVKEAGANILVAGSYIVSSDNFSERVKSLKE